MIDYKQTKAPKTTITRDLNELTEKVGNVYETVAIIGKRSNQISTALKKELDAKLQDFSVPQDSIEETFENKEQIEISRSYEQLPKPTLIATQEFINDELRVLDEQRIQLGAAYKPIKYLRLQSNLSYTMPYTANGGRSSLGFNLLVTAMF